MMLVFFFAVADDDVVVAVVVVLFFLVSFRCCTLHTSHAFATPSSRGRPRRSTSFACESTASPAF